MKAASQAGLKDLDYPMSGGELLEVCMQGGLFRRTNMEAPCGWMGEPGGREATV